MNNFNEHFHSSAHFDISHIKKKYFFVKIGIWQNKYFAFFMIETSAMSKQNMNMSIEILAKWFELQNIQSRSKLF